MLAAQRTGEGFTDGDIVGNVLLAREDTTAHTMGWTVWLLASRPDIQERMRAEAAAAFGDSPFADEYEVTERLPYIEAVLRESMRLKSVSPLLAVETLEEKTICGTTIPAGTRLILLLRQAVRTAAGRSEDFYPERWLEGGEEMQAPKSLRLRSRTPLLSGSQPRLPRGQGRPWHDRPQLRVEARRGWRAGK
jgi:cytochrome P450